MTEPSRSDNDSAEVAPLNPYDPSAVASQHQSPKMDRNPFALTVLLQYLGSYVAGVFACVAFTPVTMILIGFPLILVYPIFAIPGFALFYFELSSAQLPLGRGVFYWSCFAFGFTPIVMEVAMLFVKSRSMKRWRPLWIALPIGFVGTVGVYGAAALSV